MKAISAQSHISLSWFLLNKHSGHVEKTRVTFIVVLLNILFFCVCVALMSRPRIIITRLLLTYIVSSGALKSTHSLTAADFSLSTCSTRLIIR